MLRTATADLHAKVDVRFSGAFDEDRNAYAQFLSTLARAVIPLEQAFAQAGVKRLLPDWPQRRRTPALIEDLATLDVLTPPAAPVPTPESDASLLGMVYVLEGSRLGGKLLLRRARANPDPQVRLATHYLAHGEGLDLWRPFLQRLEASAAVTEAPQEAVAGARAAFMTFTAGAMHA